MMHRALSGIEQQGAALANGILRPQKRKSEEGKAKEKRKATPP